MSKQYNRSNPQYNFNNMIHSTHKDLRGIVLTNFFGGTFLFVFLGMAAGSSGDLTFLLSFLMIPLVIYVVVLNISLYVGYLLYIKNKKHLNLNTFLFVYLVSPYLLFIILSIFL